jgi:hypothetical protein
MLTCAEVWCVEAQVDYNWGSDAPYQEAGTHNDEWSGNSLRSSKAAVKQQ